MPRELPLVMSKSCPYVEGRPFPPSSHLAAADSFAQAHQPDVPRDASRDILLHCPDSCPCRTFRAIEDQGHTRTTATHDDLDSHRFRSPKAKSIFVEDSDAGARENWRQPSPFSLKSRLFMFWAAGGRRRRRKGSAASLFVPGERKSHGRPADLDMVVTPCSRSTSLMFWAATVVAQGTLGPFLRRFCFRAFRGSLR